MPTSFHPYDLSPEILKALSHLTFTKPTDVQAEVLPYALKGRDLLVQAETGSGKTAAFVIPICEAVKWEENQPQALILTPTRELAAQIQQDATDIGRLKRIKATAIYGKQPFAKQKEQLKQKNHMVVGTPGRLLDHLEKGTFPLAQLRYVVVDEADEMLNRGFLKQVESILKRLPSPRITMLFSATLPADVVELSATYMTNAKQIQIASTAVMTEAITHMAIAVREREKEKTFQAITTVENPDSCIVFCNTQEKVDALFKHLRREGYPCNKLHGGLYQRDRFAVMNAFKRRVFRYLIATNVAARGIDIENVPLVIHYDLPNETESYVHRSGRTGRAGASGKAIAFFTEAEEERLKEIEDYIGFTITRRETPTSEAVKRAEKAFRAKLAEQPQEKEATHQALNEGITKLYFNGGKRKKLRAVDFVGTIAKLDGVEATDIGIITIEETRSFVEILNGKGPLVLRAMTHTPVKGKPLKVYQAKE
ncbi:DEAD/DEAH box helicase [Shouchella shacheensis]|uniref:DEAD/DEAH box helicase n=1 Tax=Shouchella shacheensis TaxID=1649580 RepID=UPI0007405595|nr:DEAD/DEAH box helicase [Shouchella shacheensis]